jgi:hypothetical protein
MTPRPWDDDENLLTELAGALRGPGFIAGAFLDAGKAAYIWRTVDAELTALAYDSSLDDELFARIRSGGTLRTLVFDSPDLSVEIEMTGEGIVGQLLPPVGGRVTIMTADGPFDQAVAEDIGCFTLRAPPPGPVRLDCQTDDARLVTEWVCV